MAKLWEVLHEVQNGKAVKICSYTYFLKDGKLFWMDSNKRPRESSSITSDEECTVVDLPEELVELVDFFTAMNALLNGKTVVSYGDGPNLRRKYIFDKKTWRIVYEGTGNSTAGLTNGEISGKWRIL